MQNAFVQAIQLRDFFRPVKIGEHVLVDGGVRSNLPTEIAQAEGAPIVVAVRLQAYLAQVKQKKFDTIMDYGDRITSIFLAEIENKAVDKSDILIEPKNRLDEDDLV